MLGTEHGRFEEAHERFGRELPGPVVDQRVEKAPEENEHHDVEDVLTPQLLEGLRTAGVEKERTADHHEHGTPHLVMQSYAFTTCQSKLETSSSYQYEPATWSRTIAHIAMMRKASR